MKMPSTAVLLRVADVMEGRATVEMVEPYLQADVQEALTIYRQSRAIPLVDELDEDEVATLAAHVKKGAAHDEDKPAGLVRAEE